MLGLVDELARMDHLEIEWFIVADTEADFKRDSTSPCPPRVQTAPREGQPMSQPGTINLAPSAFGV